MPNYLTPVQIAELLGVDGAKVNRWITSGELIAVNVARSARGAKARWRISPADLDAFIASRRTQAPTPKPTKRRRLPAVTEYV